MELNQMHNIRHSLAHVLASSVLKLFPDANLGVGPVIENGCYYDFLLPRTLTADDLKNIERGMKKLIAQNLPFARKELPSSEAKKFFSDRKQTFKVELINDIEKYGTTAMDEARIASDGSHETDQHNETGSSIVSIYTTGDFVDLCRGGHVDNTKELNVDAFKIDKVAGAYWRGSEKNPQMQRIYVLAFATKAELDDYLKRREEAEKRDHKKLGQQLDLFVFSDLVGAGLPLFTPKGTIIREELENFVQALQVPLGYQRVRIPHITKRELYEKSGHWQKFHDELFKVTTREKHEFAMKPMNCPHHTQIYASRKRSYRELPLRLSEVTMCYRDEQTGELAGLSRLRSFTQDDAHVFCRINQCETEILKVWDIIDKFYKPFKMPLTVRFSRHDPKHFEKCLGEPATWKTAEDTLLAIIKKRGAEYVDGLGEAAMYGPKIDFIAKDALGREWQLATIQLDLIMPQRFGLTCVNEKGEDEPIAMVHRAILGSVERFMAILIEHYAGAFPAWLAPVQVAVLSIGKAHKAYAKAVAKELRLHDFRIELRDDDESVGKKIRESEMQKIPYILIVGDKEKAKKAVSVRKRGKGDTGAVKLKKFIETLKLEIEKKK